MTTKRRHLAGAERNSKMLPCWLWRWGKGQGPRDAALEAEKGQDMDSPPEPPEGLWSCRLLDFSPVKPISVFFIIVVICCRSNGKLIQKPRIPAQALHLMCQFIQLPLVSERQFPHL